MNEVEGQNTQRLDHVVYGDPKAQILSKWFIHGPFLYLFIGWSYCNFFEITIVTRKTTFTNEWFTIDAEINQSYPFWSNRPIIRQLSTSCLCNIDWYDFTLKVTEKFLVKGTILFLKISAAFGFWITGYLISNWRKDRYF